jgi:hypothetical protein
MQRNLIVAATLIGMLSLMAACGTESFNEHEGFEIRPRPGCDSSHAFQECCESAGDVDHCEGETVVCPNGTASSTCTD